MGTNLVDITEHIEDILCACSICRAKKHEYLRVPVQDPDIFKGLPYAEPVPERVNMQYEEYRLDRFVNNVGQVIYKYIRQINNGWWFHKPTRVYRYYDNNLLRETMTEDHWKFMKTAYGHNPTLKGELYR
jgi:hypothetical protein